MTTKQEAVYNYVKKQFYKDYYLALKSWDMSTYTICKFKTQADYETAVNWFKNTEALAYASPGEVGYNDEEFEIGTMDFYTVEDDLAPLVSYMEVWFDADEWGTDESKATFVDGKMVSVEKFYRHPIFGYWDDMA